MHIVTVLRRPDPIERATAALAARQGISAYEARTRLSGELPRIVGVLADPAAAGALVQGLLADGFVAAALDAAAIEHDDARDIVKSMDFGPESVTAALRGLRTRTIDYADIGVIIQGMRIGVTTTTEETRSKKFDAGRAILSGGLVMRKSVTTTSTKTSEAREGFVYVYARSGGPSLAVYERSTNYAFLGAALQPSSMANLLRVVDELHRRAPDARVDTRLTRPVGFGTVPLAPPGIDPAAWKADLAAALFTL